MLDIKFIRENIDLVKQNCKNRLANVDINELLKLDDERRGVETKIDKLRSERNKVSKTKPSPAEIEKMKEIGSKIKILEDKYNTVYKGYKELLSKVPNTTLADVPIGKDERDNVVLREFGKKPKFTFKPKEHWELGAELDIIDIPRATKVSGQRFNYLKGNLALLQFSLIQLAYLILTSQKNLKKIVTNAKLKTETKPFIPIIPPVMIKPEPFQRMARLEPKEERYYIPSDDIYLVGSAEHTLGSIHMDEVINEADLPIRYAGYSTAFRREAGSYGKDLKGILRVHQFDKLEIESFTLPEKSTAEQNLIVAIQEHLMRLLEIPYRVVGICTGDMSAPDARQIDIECWMPGQNKYRETHTSDLNTDYQSRRLNIKVKRANGNLEFVHMNDATVFAIGRTLIAIMENYQQPDGSIKIPKILFKYLPNKIKIIKKN